MNARLRTLQIQIDAIRNELGFSGRGEILYHAACSADNEFVVVEADGFGGATTKVTKGNYPIDFFAKYQKFFAKEVGALEAAENIVEGNGIASEIPG